jgi:hypothetical protein
MTESTPFIRQFKSDAEALQRKLDAEKVVENTRRELNGLLEECAHVMGIAREYISGAGLGATVTRTEIMMRLGEMAIQARSAARATDAT